MPRESRQYAYDELSIGKKAEFDFVLSPNVIADFAKLSGDSSSLHVDPEYAAGTEYKHPIAHGMIAGMLFSRLVGMEMPGKYCVYLSQALTFHRPMFAGSTLVVSGEIIHKSDAVRSLTITTEVRDKATGELLVNGRALVRVLK